jgi:HNH endonuclease
LRRTYSPEEQDFIKSNLKGRTIPELTDMFNAHFNLDLRRSQIRAFVKNRGLKNGVDGRFKKGQAPPNKGKKTGGWEPTYFKKGHTPHTYKPVGTERVNGDGYIDVKVADPNKWRAKHLLVWEEAHGPIPPGHVILFGDGNRKNLDINNLIMVTRKQLAILNKKGLISNHADLTRTGIMVADLYGKINERKKR